MSISETDGQSNPTWGFPQIPAKKFRRGVLFVFLLLLVLFFYEVSDMWIPDGNVLRLLSMESPERSIQDARNASEVFASSNCSKTGEPVVELLRDRPEVQEAIRSRIDDDTKPADRWRINVMPARPAEYWRQHSFSTHGIYGFIQYSGYRAGPRTVVNNGLHATVLRKLRDLSEGCIWYGKDSYQRGTLRLDREGTAIVGSYEVAVLTCDFPEKIAPGGGRAEAVIDRDAFVMYVEDADFDENSVSGMQDPKYNLVYCSTCFHDSMVPQLVWEFMEYHRVLYQVEHFFMYDGGAINEAFHAKIAPYKEAGLLTVTDIREILLFTVHYWGQTLAMNDCVYRNRFTARWILTTDVDEYLQVGPGKTLEAFLKKYHNKTFISHGAFTWETERCLPAGDGDSFMVERMVYRSKQPYCEKPEWNPKLCWDVFGHRKMFVNPLKTNITQVHTIVGAYILGGHLNAGEDVWDAHFGGLGASYAGKSFCRRDLNDSILQEGFVYDDSIAKLIPIVKACKFPSEKDCAAKYLQANGSKSG